MNECMGERMDEGMNEYMNKWMKELMGWMDLITKGFHRVTILDYTHTVWNNREGEGRE